MKGFLFCSLVLLVLALSACGSPSTTAAPPTPTPLAMSASLRHTLPTTPTPTPMTNHYTVKLSALNGSGVSGTVDLQLTGNILAVTVNVTGLVPNQIHFQHIQ